MIHSQIKSVAKRLDVCEGSVVVVSPGGDANVCGREGVVFGRALEHELGEELGCCVVAGAELGAIGGYKGGDLSGFGGRGREKGIEVSREVGLSDCEDPESNLLVLEILKIQIFRADLPAFLCIAPF